MSSIEKLGLATQEQSVLLEILNREHGAIVVLAENRDHRLGTLRTLQLYLESQRREITPLNERVPVLDEITPDRMTGAGVAVERRAATMGLQVTRPAVLLLPECEDLELLEEGLEQGRQGALVLTSAVGVDGAAFLTSLRVDGLAPTLLAESVKAVITQHAIPKACPLCRVELAPSFQLEEAFELSFGALGFPFPGFSLREGRGCHTCDFTGYLGTIMVYEFLHVTPALRQPLVDREGPEDLDSKAMGEGMLPWEAKLYFRLKHGDVALKDAIAVIERAQER